MVFHYYLRLQAFLEIFPIVSSIRSILYEVNIIAFYRILTYIKCYIAWTKLSKLEFLNLMQLMPAAIYSEAERKPNSAMLIIC